MPTKAGPKDSNIDSLVFGYNMADLAQSYDGYPVSNSVPSTETLRRYNNPGFSGYNRKTDRVHPVTNTPIWELAFYPQDEARVPRLTSTEGYGCYHGMSRNLYAGTVYLASIMMKEGPGTRFIDNDMNHGYSNIGGWNNNGTTRTKEYVGNGWWRFYTLWNNQTTAYSADGVTPLCNRYNGNTYTTYQLEPGENIVSTDINMVQYTPGGQANYKGTYDITSYIQNDYDSVGASMIDWGLDEAMTKPVYDPVFNYPDYLGTRRVFYKINMPAAGSIRMRTYHYAVMTYLSDSKFWKIRFSDTALNKRELMWVTAPMIHEVPSTSYKKPWVYVDGDRTGGLRSLANNVQLDLSAVSKNQIEEGFYFDGTDDFINTGINSPNWAAETFTIEGWVRYDNINGDDGWFELQRNGSNFGLTTVVRTNKFYFYWIGHGSNAGYNISSSAFISNSWIHITITHQGTESTTNTDVYANTKIYINGEHVPHASGGSAAASDGGELLVGSQQYSFAGDIPYFKYYNRELTADEISANYRSTKSRFQ